MSDSPTVGWVKPHLMLPTMEYGVFPTPKAIDVRLFGSIDNQGALDAGVAAQAALDSLVGTGRGLYFPTGRYKFTSRGMRFASGKAPPIIFGPNVTLVTSLSTTVADETGFLFSSTATQNQVTTLSAAATIGAATVTVASAAALAIGQKIFIFSTDGASAIMVYITNIAGTTVTLERPLTRTFPSASTVWIVTAGTEDIRIIGNGATITGTCYRYMELDHVYRGRVEGFNFSDASGFATNTACVFDTSSYRVQIVDCTSVGASAFAFESVDDGLISGCSTYAKGTLTTGMSGIYMSDCTGCVIWNCKAHGFTAANGAGVNLTSQGSLGCLDSQVIGGEYANNLTGVNLNTGARLALTDVSALNCSTGVNINNVSGVMCKGVAAISCVNSIAVSQSTQCEFYGLDVSGFTDSGVDAVSDVTILGFKGTSGIINGSRNVACRATTCAVEVVGFDISLGPAAEPGGITPNAFIAAAGGVIRASKGSVHLQCNPCAGGQVAFAATGASPILIVEDVDVDDPSGAGASKFVWNTSATTIVRHSRVRYAAAGFTTAIAGLSSRGTTTLVAGTKVIAWADLKSDDFVRVQLKTAGGTLGQLSVAMTPGTGFTINSSSGTDTSVVEYEVV